MPKLFVDADACPVKREVCKVAGRHALAVTFVANTRMRIPRTDRSSLVVVSGGFDAADDWITERVSTDDIVVTADILLAKRCIDRAAHVIGPTGRRLHAESIGQALAMRQLMSDLREAGEITGGPAPFQQRDRSRFVHQLDQLVRDIISGHLKKTQRR